MSVTFKDEVEVSKQFSKKLFFPSFPTIEAWNKAIRENKDRHNISSLPLNLTAPIRYAEETMRDLLKTKRWLLFFDPGFSIKKIHTIVGTDFGARHCFLEADTWWLEEEWAFYENEPAFRLISRPEFRDRDWVQQEKIIRAMGDNFCRASLRTAVMAGVTWALLDHLRLPLGGAQHWSREEDDLIGKIFFDFDEFSFAAWPHGCHSGSLGACLMRKFDF